MKNYWIVAGVGVAVVGAGIAWQASRSSLVAPAEQASTSTMPATEETTTTAVKPPASSAPYVFPLNRADSLASWSFTALDTGNAVLTAATDADKAKLAALLGGGMYDDYDLYIGIGNDADLEGDGRAAYTAYDKAVAIHSNKGLAYANLGHLFDELGAYHTAADAYAKAVAVEPGVIQYHLARLDFLTKRFPTDETRLAAAFDDAHNQFGDTASVLSIKAEWLEGEGRYADAIKAWQTAKTLSSPDRRAAIDAQIARDKAKAAAQ